MINKLEGFYIIEKLKLKHPEWSIITLNRARRFIKKLDDDSLYTVRTALTQTTREKKDFWLPRMLSVKGKDVKKKFGNFANQFEPDEEVFIIIYPYFEAKLSGDILLIFESNPINSSKTVIVEGCDGSLQNLTHKGITDYKARVIINNVNEIIEEHSDIPHWNILKKQIIKIIKNLPRYVDIHEKTDIRIEFSLVDDKFLFYELKTV